MKENWGEFVANRFETQRENYNKTDAGRHRRATDLANHTRLENNLTNDQQAMVEGILFDRCVACLLYLLLCAIILNMYHCSLQHPIKSAIIISIKPTDERGENHD